MGDWAIVITGTGQHHNDKAEDANVMADQFVGALLAAGQQVRAAEFVSGQKFEMATRRVRPATPSVPVPQEEKPE